MKTVSKKLFSMLLVMVLLVCAVPFQVFAANDCTVNADVVLNGHTVANVTVTTTANVGDILNVQDDATVVSAIQSFYGTDADNYTVSSVTNNGSAVDGHAVTVTGNMNLKVNITLVNPKAYTMTLNANGGKYNDADSVNVTYYFGQPMQNPNGTLTAPDGYQFVGWREPGVDTNFNFSQLYKYSGNKTLNAVWALKTGTLTVKMRIGSVETGEMKLIKEVNLPQGTNVLDYVKTGSDVVSLVNAAIPSGYTWDGLFFNSTKCDSQVPQSLTVKGGCDIYVRVYRNKYTAYFNPVGGTISKTSKEVDFGGTLTLPIPKCDGKLFVGWQDVDGKIYTPGSDGKIKMVYKIPGDSTFTAVWNDQAKVLLRVYINGNTSSPDVLLDVTNKTTGSKLTYTEARKLVRARYAPTSGSSVQMYGLFDEDSWKNYVATKDGSIGADSIIIPNTTETTEIYVMAPNARIAGGVTNVSAATSVSGGTADPTNPKSGDGAMIEAAFAVMILSAAAAATVIVLRKKEIF